MPTEIGQDTACGKANAATALADRVRRHAALRFAAGVTVAFVLSEALRWTPTFLAPVLVGLLLVQLPQRPTPGTSAALVLLNLLAAAVVLLLCAALLDMPIIFLGALALLLVLCFLWIAQGRPRLPALLMLLYAVIVPVIALDTAGGALALTSALVGSFMVAIVITWLVYLPWPAARPAAAPGVARAVPSPARAALLGAAILLALMTVFLSFGLSQALPALVSTMLVLSRLDMSTGRQQAVALVAGNLQGGVAALVVYSLLSLNPSLLTLALLVLLAGLWFGGRIAQGAQAGVAFIACNTLLIVLGSGLAQNGDTLLGWINRLMYIVAAAGFSMGMMSLLWRRAEPSPAGL